MARHTNHKIVNGAWKKKLPGAPSRTRSSKARVVWAYPPLGGWPGGSPNKNGCPWAK